MDLKQQDMIEEFKDTVTIDCTTSEKKKPSMDGLKDYQKRRKELKSSQSATSTLIIKSKIPKAPKQKPQEVIVSEINDIPSRIQQARLAAQREQQQQAELQYESKKNDMVEEGLSDASSISSRSNSQEQIRAPPPTVSSKHSEDEQDSSGISKASKKIQKKKKFSRDPRYKTVTKVIEISPVKEIPATDPITKKLYRVRIKYLGGDQKVHGRWVAFGCPPTVTVDSQGKQVTKYPDYIGHFDEDKRWSTQVRFRRDPAYTPLDSAFYRKYLLNNKASIKESYEDMKQILQKAWQYTP